MKSLLNVCCKLQSWSVSKKEFPMNHFSGKFLSNCSFVLLSVASSERLHSKTSLLETREASKEQKEKLACAPQNDCSKIGKPQRESLRRGSVLETLPCNFIKTGLHHWYFLRNVPTFFGQAISQNTYERLLRKAVHLISRPNRYCFDRATVEV